jgi:serine/threonine protein phosphatase PrpC
MPLFARRGKIFVGHCGDSGIVLGEQDEKNPDVWKYKTLTK